MTALGTTRKRRTAPLAALLLVFQGLAGPVVALAHASEPVTGPAHFEAQHSSGCVPLHDAVRCALCHYAGTRVVPEQVRPHPAGVASAEQRPDQTQVARPGSLNYPTARPRAPPSHAR